MQTASSSERAIKELPSRWTDSCGSQTSAEMVIRIGDNSETSRNESCDYCSDRAALAGVDQIHVSKVQMAEYEVKSRFSCETEPTSSKFGADGVARTLKVSETPRTGSWNPLEECAASVCQNTVITQRSRICKIDDIEGSRICQGVIYRTVWSDIHSVRTISGLNSQYKPIWEHSENLGQLAESDISLGSGPEQANLGDIEGVSITQRVICNADLSDIHSVRSITDLIDQSTGSGDPQENPGQLAKNGIFQGSLPAMNISHTRSWCEHRTRCYPARTIG